MTTEPARQSATASSVAQELRAIVSLLKRRLREQANVGDLTPSQISVLLRLETSGPTTASGLARAEGMRPQSVAPILAALEEGGYIGKSPDPADGRKSLVALTPAFQQRVAQGRSARHDWLVQSLQTSFSAQELEQISTTIELLQRIARE